MRRVRERLAGARELLFVTGAGVSADSGLPTYRGVGGLYDDDLTEDGMPIEEMLSGPMLTARPELCWKHIHRIEQACRGAEPNRAHRVIAAAQQRFERVVVLTQNVDGLHAAAGSLEVVTLHGDVHDLLCTACPWRDRVVDYAGLEIPPACPDCGGLVRPDVVLFGELLPPAAVTALRTEPSPRCDVVFSVGTSSQFPYITGVVAEAARRGLFTVEVNPEPTIVTSLVDVSLPLGAAEAFEALADALV